MSRGDDMQPRFKIGVSSCLLGEPVRYDGGHKHDHYITDVLGRYMEFVPVCPEVEMGLPVPREAMRLEGDAAHPRLMTIKTRVDHTAEMQRWAAGKLDELGGERLCGFIFKSRSPSSGMARVKLYDDNAVPRNAGVGIWAAEFMRRFPLLPVEEEGRLNDPVLRENFIDSIFVMARWRETLDRGLTPGALVDFHSRHKYQLMAHSPKHYRMLGKLVALAGAEPLDELKRRYESLLFEALRFTATVSKNVNVLQHIVGYFKKELTPDEKAELLEVIERYRDQAVPLIVPVTLLNHYVRKYGKDYLAIQSYLHPHPVELKLRNHS